MRFVLNLFYCLGSFFSFSLRVMIQGSDLSLSLRLHGSQSGKESAKCPKISSPAQFVASCFGSRSSLMSFGVFQI